MKKQSVLTVGILFVLSIVCFFYVSNRSKNAIRDTYPWSEARKDALVSLELEDYRPNSPRKFVLSQENGVWGIFKPIHYAVSQDRIAIFATTFMNLKPKNIFTNVSPEEYNAYGFNNPQMRINAKIKGLPDSTILLGTSTTLGGDVYTALESNKDVVYLLSASEASIILGGLNVLLNSTPFNREYDDNSQVLVKNLLDEDWDFIKTNGFWVLQPSMETNKDWGMRRFLLQTKDLRFETNLIRYDVSSSELNDMGINVNESPYLRIRNSEASYTVFLGAEQEGMYQAYIPEMQMGVSISSALVHQVFRISLNDLTATRRR
ncbi:MAG: DUF4340 domain-containing protein [Brevinema sp.]